MTFSEKVEFFEYGGGKFGTENWAQLDKLSKRNRVRGDGVAKLASGASLVALAPRMCKSPGGCVVAGLLVWLGGDIAGTGAQQLPSGNPQTSSTSKVLARQLGWNASQTTYYQGILTDLATLAAGGVAIARGRTLFTNRAPAHLAAELQQAKAMGFTPVNASKATIKSLSGQRIKWVVTQEGNLVVGPHSYLVNGFRAGESSHAVLSGGKGVQAAGEAFIEAGSNKSLRALMFTRHSGHFAPTAGSETVGRLLFEKLGVSF